jgi:phasin family protein
MANNNNPMFDFNQWFSQLNIPGVNLQALIESSRKDWEALQKATENSISGWQKLGQRQQELAQQAISQWQSEFTQSLSRTPQENAEKMRESVEQGLANMRELADIINKSQSEASEILQQRFEQNMQRLMNTGSAPAKKKPAAKKPASKKPAAKK